MEHLNNHGFNKLLLEARLNLNLSRKEAAKALGISYTYLMRIEKGYAIVQDNLQPKFIEVYKLEENFFSNDLCYPVEVDIKSYKNKQFSKAYEFFLSIKFKVISFLLSLGFIAQTVSGALCLPAVRGNTAEFFSKEVKDTYQYVLQNGQVAGDEDKNSELGTLALDKRHIIKLEGDSKSSFEELKINYFDQQRNLPYAFFQGKYSCNDEYRLVFEHRYVGNYSYRVHCYLITKEETPKVFSRMTCDVDKKNLDEYKYSFKTVSSIGDEIKLLKESDPLYTTYTTLFKDRYPGFDGDLSYLFKEKLSSTNLTYTEYSIHMNKEVGSFSSYRYAMQMILLWGIIFTAVFVILFITSTIKKSHLNKRLKLPEIPDEIETDDYSDVKVDAVLTPVPKNKGMNLLINEFTVRAISLLFLFLSSMVTYFVFLESLHLAVPSANTSDIVRNLISNLSIVAVLTLYFLKLDIYQNKKNAAAFSWFLFITGLLYYLLIVVVYFILDGITGSTDILGTILNYLPGNIVWAVLTFNAFTIFLFSKPNFKKETPTKRLLFRLCSLIPLSYLLISSVISIGMKAYDWNIHYLVSSLLFFKAPYITVFALFYSLFVFFYRRYTVKKYGEENALLYQQGNKYNFYRNIAACALILILGIIDIIFLVAAPNNKFGFGTNFIILIAIPLLLFYRPHFGKRNATWDLIYNLLYVFVYIAGIIAIVIAVISFLTTI